MLLKWANTMKISWNSFWWTAGQGFLISFNLKFPRQQHNNHTDFVFGQERSLFPRITN